MGDRPFFPTPRKATDRQVMIWFGVLPLPYLQSPRAFDERFMFEGNTSRDIASGILAQLVWEIKLEMSSGDEVAIEELRRNPPVIPEGTRIPAEGVAVALIDLSTGFALYVRISVIILHTLMLH